MLRNCKAVRVLPRIADCAKNDRNAILRARLCLFEFLICDAVFVMLIWITFFLGYCRCCEYALLVLEHWPDAPEIQRSADLYEDLIRCCVADAMSEVLMLRIYFIPRFWCTRTCIWSQCVLTYFVHWMWCALFFGVDPCLHFLKFGFLFMFMVLIVPVSFFFFLDVFIVRVEFSNYWLGVLLYTNWNVVYFLFDYYILDT